MKRTLMAMALMLPFFLLTGCDEDQRKPEEKEQAPKPELSTRYTMSCPKCGAPQRPYRITPLKSYYKCEGKAPKFPYHKNKEWTHRISDHDKEGNVEH